MKYLILIPVVAIFASCASTANGPQIKGDFAARVRNFITVVEPSFRPAASGACSLAVSLTPPADQASLRVAIYKISSVVAAWDGQSPADFIMKIQGLLPNTPEGSTLGASIGGLVAIASPFIKGDPQLLLKVTTDLAAGCADSTRTITP